MVARRRLCNGQSTPPILSASIELCQTIARKHALTAMGLLNRNVTANGAIPSYREDWVFRTTYTFDGKYTLEYNGAYNGSEKFAPEYRFAFFSSGGIELDRNPGEFHEGNRVPGPVEIACVLRTNGF